MLQADLTCSSGAFAVQLMRNARLQLNGHTLARVDDAGGSGTATVLGSGDGMAARFKILGPGTIAGTSADPHFPRGTEACVQASDSNVKISGGAGRVDIHGCIYGVLGSASGESNGAAKLDILNADVHDCLFDGVAVKTSRRGT